jgi:restriction endonuclease S subunit
MNHSRCTLKDCAELIRGITYHPNDVCKENEGVPLLRSSNIQNGVLVYNDLLFVNPSLVSKDQYLRRGDILVCTSNGSKQLVGKPGVFENDVPMSFGAFCKTIRLKNNSPISQSFLEMFFLSRNYRNQIFQESKGIGIQNLKDNALENLTFPVFPREDQDKMCLFGFKLLKEIRKDKKMLSLMDELVKSRFNESFSSCNLTMKIGSVSSICRGASPRPIDRFFTSSPEGINWIKIGDVSPNALYITKTDQKITYEGAKKSRAVKPGDFILSNSMSFGRPYILKISGCVHDGWLIISDYETHLDPLYFYYALRSDFVQDQFASLASGSTVRNLNSDLVKKCLIPIPNLKLQKDFSAFARQIDKLKFDIEKRLALEQELFDAKMHEFFD